MCKKAVSAVAKPSSGNQAASTYFGHGIIKDGAFKMPASEVLNDNESVLMVIYEAGPQAAMVKTSKCERVQ